MAELIHGELSRKIIAAAMKVSSTLRPGLGERLYENALVIELIKRGHRVDQQKAFPVFYEGSLIGKLVPDLMVDELVIVDPKVVVDFNQDHVSQMVGCLSITRLKLAILLNFKYASLRWKRVVWEGGEASEVADLAGDMPPAL
jgi:GxxExxY protein